MKNGYIYEIENLDLSQEALMVSETIFHNANGYLGVRSNYEEGYPKGTDSIRGMYINGVYDIASMKQAEKLCGLTEDKQTMLNVADTQGIELLLEDETFSMFSGTVLESRRRLDMKKGITSREVLWKSPKGRTVRIVSKRMASFVQKELFTIEYSVEAVDFEGNVAFISRHLGEVSNYSNPDDPRVADESEQYIQVKQVETENQESYIKACTKKSAIRLATAVGHRILKGNRLLEDINWRTDKKETEAVFQASLPIHKNERVTLVKYCVFTDSLRYQEPDKKGRELLKKAEGMPLEDWYQKQEDYLTDFWESSDLEISGDEKLNQAVRYNIYQLLQSAGKDEYCSIAAKGLSGEGYEGHYFWDTEMYIQPFFTLTNPEVSKSLLEYRYTILPYAREHARILGHKKGALYPWRTIMGRECSGYFPSGSAQYHINGDIAYAVVAYYLATKDLDFIAEKGAEIIFETARLWLDVGNIYDGHFQIMEVTGPDEYTCLVDNNYYTNVCAQYNFHWAVRFYELLSEAGLLSGVAERIDLKPEEIEAFSIAEKTMYLPYDETLGINPQDDSFLKKKKWDLKATPKENFPLLLHYHPLYIYRHQVCKQADTVLAHFVFEDAQSIETIRKSFLYYEDITTHDSSLSTCIFSIVASRLGMADKAYQYFGDSAKLDLFNTHKNTKDGIHTANMGGNYMAIVYGFGGLRLKEKGLFLAPMLPKDWESYSFRLCYQGRKIQVEVDCSGCRVKLLSGEPVEIVVYGEKRVLKDTLDFFASILYNREENKRKGC